MCIGIDPDIREFLQGQEMGITEFVNQLIRSYMESKPVRDSVGEIKKPSIDKDRTSSMKDPLKIEEEKQLECEENIRKVIINNPDRWLRTLHTSKVAPSKQIQTQILEETRWTCNEAPTLRDVENVLRDVFVNYDFSKMDEEDRKRKGAR
jgi:hypothetical protein